METLKLNHHYVHFRVHWCIILTLILTVITGHILNAQQISPQVISASGAFYSNQYGSLSFTAGEMAAVETFSSEYNILTQGFQQVWDLGTYITEYPEHDFSFGVYPNPSDGNFDLLIQAENNYHLTVRILNILGKEIQQKEFYHQRKINIEPFDLSEVAAGIYFVALTVRKNNSPQSENYFVRKIHIVK